MANGALNRLPTAAGRDQGLACLDTAHRNIGDERRMGVATLRANLLRRYFENASSERLFCAACLGQRNRKRVLLARSSVVAIALFGDIVDE